MPLLSIITPTGNRQQAFALCERYMAAQTFPEFEWVVVDDGEMATSVTMGQHVIRPNPRWLPGQASSQTRNLLEGLSYCHGEYVAVVEDDDAYLPGHLQRVMRELAHRKLVGECPALYYHVRNCCYRDMGNRFHASLCQTAFHRSMIHLVQDICHESSAFIDIRLWARTPLKDRMLYEARNVVGIKGMPGRDGVSGLHRDNGHGWTADYGLTKLREWIGDYAANYEHI